MKKLIYALFLDKEDTLDLAQLFFLNLNVLFTMVVVNVGRGVWTIPDAVLDAFLIVYGTTVLLASPMWLAKLWIEKKDWFKRAAVERSTDINELSGQAQSPQEPQSGQWIG